MTPFSDSPDDALLAQAAELRAGGASWEATARQLGTTAAELRRLVAAQRPAYRRHYTIARADVLDEALAEALFCARRHLRSDEEKVAQVSADRVFRLWARAERYPTTRGELNG